MQNSSREKAYSERRLARAADYVTDRWFPVNPDLFAQIKKDLAAGRYDSDLEGLLDEVRHDFALFAYCLRELAAMLRQSGAVVPLKPVEIFTAAGLDALKAILAVEEHTISHHRIKAMTPLQQSRFEEALLSASTAQALSTATDLDSQICFSTALLRQLGMTLIAWNYPSVYEQAVHALKEGEGLDQVIARILGYSPSLLAIRILESWGLHRDAASNLETEDEGWFDCDPLVGATAAPTYATICRISETLARANHPEIYPSAEHDWHHAEEIIRRHIGADGMRVIRTIFLENCAGYTDTLRPIFSGGTIVDPVYRQLTRRYDTLLERNPYIAQCRPHLEKKLLGLYQLIAQSTSPDGQLLGTLVREIVPAAGFTGGIIFTVEPTLVKLIPQLVIGHPRTHAVTDVNPQRLSDSVARAFESVAPITTEFEIDGAAKVVAITGVLGYSQRVGTILLELPRQIFLQSTAAHLTHFKAIAQSFNECLKLH
jgi:hypothetical protein